MKTIIFYVNIENAKENEMKALEEKVNQIEGQNVSLQHL